MDKKKKKTYLGLSFFSILAIMVALVLIKNNDGVPLIDTGLKYLIAALWALYGLAGYYYFHFKRK